MTNFRVPIFDVKHLYLSIKKQTILSNISLEIFSGEYVAIIGPNGGGKTTFVKTLLNLIRPSSGTIKIYGKDIKKFKKWHKIGYVPQRASLTDKNFPATAYDIVKMGIVSKKSFFGFITKEDKDLIKDAMLKMDVWSLKDKLIGELSGGQRQRVMIARALSQKPDILILDEPNTGVDIINQKKFYELLRDINKKYGITILFITHDFGVIADDITKLISINQKAFVCTNPTHSMKCDFASSLYGIDAHFIRNHKDKAC